MFGTSYTKTQLTMRPCMNPVLTEINTVFEDYARSTTLNFHDDLEWGDHWASGLTGDYRLVGFDISDNAWDHPTWADFYSVFNYLVSSQSSFEVHGKNLGHHNNPPEDGFYSI